MKKLLTLLIGTLVFCLLACTGAPRLSLLYEDQRFKLHEQNSFVFASVPLQAFELMLTGEIRDEDISVPEGFLKIVKVFEDYSLIASAGPRVIYPGEHIMQISDHASGCLDDIAIARFWQADSGRFASLSNPENNPELLGDINGDGQVDGFDFVVFADSYGWSEGTAKYRQECDYGSDTSPASKYYGGVWSRVYSLIGERAGLVDGRDFIVFANNYGFRHPYLGTWTFEGELEERETGEYGKVSGSGSGTAEVTMSNHTFHVSVDADIEINTEKEGTIKFGIEMDSSDPELDFTFAGGVMTFSGALKLPDDDTEYIGILQGTLKQEGSNIYTQVDNGTIKLEGQDEVLGTWTAEKQ